MGKLRHREINNLPKVTPTLNGEPEINSIYSSRGVVQLLVKLLRFLENTCPSHVLLTHLIFVVLLIPHIVIPVFLSAFFTEQ